MNQTEENDGEPMSGLILVHLRLAEICVPKYFREFYRY